MDTPQVDDFLVWFAGVVTALVVIVGGVVALRKLLLGAIDKLAALGLTPEEAAAIVGG